MKEHGIDVYLISNAPRSNHVVQEGLTNKLGLNPDLYKHIYTSGDIGTKFINKKIHGESYFHLGPAKDYDLLENINISKVDNFNEADFILTTGLYDDSFETPKDYNDLFNDFIESEKPIVCVNPDEIVYRGVNSIFCAGALGKYYEKLGGKVVYYGKPYVEIYDQAFSLMLLNLIVIPPGIGSVGVTWLISLGTKIPSTSSYSLIVVSIDN